MLAIRQEGINVQSGDVNMENKEMENEERQNNPLLLTIREMDFSIRTSNCLRRARVNTLEDLCKMTENEVKQVRNSNKFYGKSSFSKKMEGSHKFL